MVIDRICNPQTLRTGCEPLYLYNCCTQTTSRFAASRKAIHMDAAELYHFLFETMPGIGILIGVGLVLSIIACVVMEKRTRKVFKNHEKTEDDWDLFDDDEQDD